MMKPKKRLVKAQLKEDQFVLFTAKAETWFENHRKEVLYGLIGVLVVVGLGVAISWSKTNSEKKAAFEELLARDAYARTVLDSALIRANTIIDDYSGTSSAAVALMIKGRVHESRGEFDDALKAYEQVLDDHSSEEYLGFGACNAIATISLGRGDYKKAADYYEKAASRYSKHFAAPVALVEAGKANEKAGRFAQAKSAYREVLGNYPKSRSADAARDNLAKLEFMP